MSAITSFIGDLTGANAMREATDVQRQQYEWLKSLSEEDRKSLLGIYDQAEQSGFFDPNVRMQLYDKAVSPYNEKELRNVGQAERALGSRPGDTNAQAAIGSAIASQDLQRASKYESFFDQAFRDRMAFRQAASNAGPGMAAQAGQALSGSLMQQGQAQQQAFDPFFSVMAQYLARSPNSMGGASSIPSGGGLPVWGGLAGGGYPAFQGGPFFGGGGQWDPSASGGAVSLEVPF